MCESFVDFTWLYRGVPRESPEVADVEFVGEIRPPRPERIAERWRHLLIRGDTQTGYTSWTQDRSIAAAAAQFHADNAGLTGEIVIFRVLAGSVSEERLFPGLDDEDEWLIQGTVEGVLVSPSEADDEENAP